MVVEFAAAAMAVFGSCELHDMQLGPRGPRAFVVSCADTRRGGIMIRVPPRQVPKPPWTLRATTWSRHPGAIAWDVRHQCSTVITDKEGNLRLDEPWIRYSVAKRLGTSPWGEGGTQDAEVKLDGYGCDPWEWLSIHLQVDEIVTVSDVPKLLRLVLEGG